ncbi:hypothetical protein sos41_17510 [Alphaproteobacteria bacterium SO-S41]|nr:hypothetical protein sos41_17510 [Alphaproteobacteria bacterium SO-S41]
MRLSAMSTLSLALLCAFGAAARAEGATAPEALAGVWQDGPAGIYFVQTPDFASGGLDRRTVLFAGDRWAENPEGDLSQFNFDAARPSMSGRWSLAGDAMSMTPAEGPPRTGPVKLNPDTCFDFRDGIWCPARPFAGATLAGKYSGGSSYSSSSSAIAVASDYEFSADGTYRLLAAGSFTSAEPDGRVTAAGASEGRYRIEGLTLILTGSDGTERRDIAFPLGEGADGAAPPMIYFGGWLLTRQN